MAATDLEKSTFQNKPAYRYIRAADRMPSTAEARAQDDPMVLVKMFNPTGIGTWYLCGYDPEDRIAFGAEGRGWGVARRSASIAGGRAGMHDKWAAAGLAAMAVWALGVYLWL